MGMPFSRVGDPHVCPMVTGVVPHVGAVLSYLLAGIAD